MTRDCLFSPTHTTVGHATHATDAGVRKQQGMAQPCMLLGIHHDVCRVPPRTSQHRATQNYGDAGLASARTPTPQIHRDLAAEQSSSQTAEEGLAFHAAQ